MPKTQLLLGFVKSGAGTALLDTYNPYDHHRGTFFRTLGVFLLPRKQVTSAKLRSLSCGCKIKLSALRTPMVHFSLPQKSRPRHLNSISAGLSQQRCNTCSILLQRRPKHPDGSTVINPTRYTIANKILGGLFPPVTPTAGTKSL